MMRAAIFTIDTGIYKAKAESAAATALKRMLEQVGFQVKAAGVLPNDRAMTAEVMRRGRVRGGRLCAGCTDGCGGPASAWDTGGFEGVQHPLF